MNPPIELQQSRENIISVAKRMEQTKINQGRSGNLSIRTKKGLLITPSSAIYETLSPEDIACIDFNGNSISNKSQAINSKSQRPSSEWQLHAAIYIDRPEINAIVHCHSIHATAIACHGKGIPSFHYMAAIAGGYDVPCASYSTFGTSELAHNVVIALQGRVACLLEKHGQIAIANDLESAFTIAVEIETLAHIYLQACQLGEPKILSAKEMEIVQRKFQQMKYGDQQE